MIIENREKRVIVDVNSTQYILKQDQYITCDRINATVGSEINFNILGFASDLANFKRKGVAVFTVLEHKLGKKIRVFHKTRRNGDASMAGGSRPRLTILKLLTIKEDAQ